MRAVWQSNDSAKMLLASLKADFELTEAYHYRYRIGAALRLGYYFPKESEGLLLGLLAKIKTPVPDKASQDDSSFADGELLKAIAASKSEAVQKQVFEILKTTKYADFFLALTVAYRRFHREKACRLRLPETGLHAG